MKITVHDCDIECPETPTMLALVRQLGVSQLCELYRFQQQAKHWPQQIDIPEYCLYLGSGVGDNENVDFYHYEPQAGGEYSSAIVMGNSGGDYRSGWPSLALTRKAYKEQLRREYLCGLLRADDLIQIGVAALGVTNDDAFEAIRRLR